MIQAETEAIAQGMLQIRRISEADRNRRRSG